MGHFLAAARVAAFFIVAICSCAPALACEDCEPRNTARLDVTSAVDAAISFVVATVRKLHPTYDVQIVEGDAVGEPLTVAEYAAAYDARDGQLQAELPGFQHRYEWQLTYRDDGMKDGARASQIQRPPGTDVRLDDSSVVGLRFELDYGWKR